MSGDQAPYYDPATGRPFLVRGPCNQVPSAWSDVPTSEPAPLGSFQNPYPAHSIPPPLLPTATAPPTLYPPALAPLYAAPAQPQTHTPTHIHAVDIPVQYFHPTPLPCRGDTLFGTQQRDTATKQHYDHAYHSWWPAPSGSPSSSEALQQQPQQQQLVMGCTQCGQAINVPAPHPPPCTQQRPHPLATSALQLPIPTTSPTIASPHPPHPPPPNTLQSANPLPSHPEPPPPPLLQPPHPRNRLFPQLPNSHLESDVDFDFAFQYEVRKWPLCHVCGEKPALSEKHGVLFCRACWAEAERAQMEREREMEMGAGSGV